jgi:hypothetical protein
MLCEANQAATVLSPWSIDDLEPLASSIGSPSVGSSTGRRSLKLPGPLDEAPLVVDSAS